MRKSALWLIVFAALAGLAALPALGADDPAVLQPLSLNLAYVTAFNGDWAYNQQYGYVWKPDVMEAEWSPVMYAPFDHGRWVFVPGWGYAWCPVMPPTSVSPLGWGWDGWYGGWYGFTPDGNWAGTLTEYRPPYTYLPPPHLRGTPVSGPVGGLVGPWHRPFLWGPRRAEPAAVVPDPQGPGPRRVDPEGPRKRTEPGRPGGGPPHHGGGASPHVRHPAPHPSPGMSMPRSDLHSGGAIGGGGGGRHRH